MDWDDFSLLFRFLCAGNMDHYAVSGNYVVLYNMQTVPGANKMLLVFFFDGPEYIDFGKASNDQVSRVQSEGGEERFDQSIATVNARHHQSSATAESDAPKGGLILALSEDRSGGEVHAFEDHRVSSLT